MYAPLIRLRAEGPSLPEVSSTKGMVDAGGSGEWGEGGGVFDSAVVLPLCCLHSFRGGIRYFIGAVPFDVVVASRIHY